MVGKTQPNKWPFTLNEPVVKEASHLGGVPLTCNIFPLLFALGNEPLVADSASLQPPGSPAGLA